jgi:phospholipase C
LSGCQGLKSSTTTTGGTDATATLLASSLSFGSVAIGSTTAAQSSTLTDTSSTVALNIGSIALSGANPGDFKISSASTCPTSGTIQPSATCLVTITFSPTASGSRSATLTVNDNTSAGSQTVSLTGTGTGSSSPTATLLPATLGFGSIIVGSTSAAQSSTLTDTSSTVALNISSIALSGANPGDFNISSASTCPTSGTIQPSATCLVTITFSPTTTGSRSATLTVSDNTSAGSQTVSLTGTGGSSASLQSIQHVVFMLQENRSFDTYFGMLNPYRVANNYNVSEDGNTYTVDGIDDKLTEFSDPDDASPPVSFSLFKFQSTCVDDMTSDWIGSYGDVNRYNFATTRPIQQNGFVHIAEDYGLSGAGDGQFTDLVGQRAMGYYDQDTLNYYYYMASQFSISDRWFAPVSSKSTPNRIATITGGTTQGLVYDPFRDDQFLDQLQIETIFQKLDKAGVPWKIYYSITQGGCTDDDGDCGGQTGGTTSSDYPSTTFSDFGYSIKYLYENPTAAACIAPTIGSLQAVGDTTNSFCIDPTHIAPIAQYLSDVAGNTLPSYAFIETAYGHSDEHPGSGQSILYGQAQVASLINALMVSPSWSSSVFFLSYDEPGGPFDHVPPVPGHSNDFTDTSLGTIPDISSIAVNADSYFPCLPPTPGLETLHCDLRTVDPGAVATDAPAVYGFAAQIGFRLPNLVISPFARMHYVSHIPMDHTAIIKFVENRFISSTAALTARDAAQPDLLDFFDFPNTPWATPPTPPTPTAAPGNCNAANM